MGKTTTFAVAMAACVFTSCAGAPKSPRGPAYVHRGLMYLERGECGRSRASCELGLEYGAAQVEAHNCLGLIALMCESRVDDAAAHFKDALAIDSDFAQGWANLGVTFMRRNPPDYDTATENLVAAIEIDPGYADARENLALCALRQGMAKEGKAAKRRFDLALTHLARLGEIEPRRANVHYYRGVIELQLGQIERAQSSLTRCLQSRPDHDECRYNLGLAHLGRANCREAIGHLAEVAQKPSSPVHLEAKLQLREAYRACALEDGAIRRYLDTIARNPGDPASHHALGQIYEERGLLDKAEEEYVAATALAPGFCPAYHALAQVADQNLQSDDALGYCRRFIACTTDSRTATRVDGVEWCKSFVRAVGAR